MKLPITIINAPAAATPDAPRRPNLRTRPFSLKPGEEFPFKIAGNLLWFARCESPVEVALVEGHYIPAKEGMQILLAADFDTVWVRAHSTGTDVKGLLAFGHASINDFSVPEEITDLSEGVFDLADAISTLNTTAAAIRLDTAAIRADTAALAAAVPTLPALPSYADLGNLPTAALPAGRYATVIVAPGPAETWQLRADASNPPTDPAAGVIKPADYNASTNAKVWFRA